MKTWWKKLTAVALLLSCPGVSPEGISIDSNNIQAQPDAESALQSRNALQTSSYSSYPGQRTPYPYSNLDTNEAVSAFNPDPIYPANERAWYPYIINREKKKKKEQEESELAGGAPLPPVQKEKIRDYGLGPRAALLVAFIVLIIGVLSYDAFDKFTGLGGRAGGSRFNALGLSCSIDVPEIAFDALAIREEDCKQLAFCNLRKLMNSFSYMRKIMNMLGYETFIPKKFVRGDRAGNEYRTCKTVFPKCKQKFSL